MKRVPANRYLLFALIVLSGLAWDLYSKSVVFRDLGYPGRAHRPLVAGEHAVFAPRPGVEGESVIYIDRWMTFRLFTSFNHGALWGMGQGKTWLFASLSVVAVFAALYWLFVYGAARSYWLTVALSLVLAGTLGNLHDRLALHGCVDSTGQIYGEGRIHAVRDFLLFTFGGFEWPIFNFADVFLVMGACMLVIQSFRADSQPQQPKREESVLVGMGKPQP